MNEEIMTNENGMGADDFVSALAELKENTVDRAEYERVLGENRTLTNALAKGYSYNAKDEEIIDVDGLRKELFDPKASRKTDLEYFEKILKLRDGIMADGGPDPFLPHNREYKANSIDEASAQRIADGIKHCVEYA